VKRAPGALVSRYAKALFEAALDAHVLPEVRADMDAISSAWRAYPEFALLVMNPRLTRAKVDALLMSLADRVKAQDLTRRYLKLLLDHDRLTILGDVSEHFNKLWRVHEGEVELAVTTAVPLSDTLKQAVQSQLAETSGKKPLITWNHDPRLLGGIVVEWPDRVFDGSLARKLENLKQHLAQSV
jgi:F-type H+-transporting ATPase subunit delta